MKKCLSMLSILVLAALLGMLLFDKTPTSASVSTCVETYFTKPLHHLCLLQSSTTPLENCRPSCRIDEALLKQKLAIGLPRWARTQIKEDLAHFKNIDPSEFKIILNKNGIAKGFIQLVLFRIENGKIDVILPEIPDHLPNRTVVLETAERQYLPIYDVLKYLAKKNYIKATNLIFSISDFTDLTTPTTQPIFTYAKDLDNPTEKNLILFPDWMNLCTVTATRKKIRNARELYPWKDKKDLLFWRGGKNDSTGFRQKLVNYSHEHPNIVDAEFVQSNQAKFVDPVDHLQYKYLISIDGNRCSWERLVWHLHSNSLVFKHQTNQVQWFFKGISPYKDYVPILNEDDIPIQIAWANTHPKEVQSIIKNANKFIEDNLALEDLCVYIIALLQEYQQKPISRQ